ncbi:hypothetical protein EV424DRAFT_1348030 [Suillus variegatus]|nr:hypothetical protein EV424DRAFT_1348030 [Suillus variegatus]
MASDNSFWDAETRPSDWGLDSTVATAVEHMLTHVSIPFATIRENVTNARNQASLALSYWTKRLDAHDSFVRIATGQRLLVQLMEWVSGTAPLTMPAMPLSTPAVKEITEHGDVEEQPINSTVTPAEVTLFSPIAKPGQTSFLISGLTLSGGTGVT